MPAVRATQPDAAGEAAVNAPLRHCSLRQRPCSRRRRFVAAVNIARRADATVRRIICVFVWAALRSGTRLRSVDPHATAVVGCATGRDF